MLVEKKKFILPAFPLECGRVIPVEIGYETYGTLNIQKSNAILIGHYFSAFGHAAGKYSADDPKSGFWDALIGPGKAIDTNRYFVISADNLCNIDVKNPSVITTGPASIDPNTQRPYGLRFPVVTTVDLANLQKLLVESLGIQQLYAAAGPSLGGMIAMQLAVHHPTFVRKMIGVVTAPRNPVSPSFQYAIKMAAQLDPHFQNGDYYGKEEPRQALLLVSQYLTISAFTPMFLERAYPRQNDDEAPYRDIQNTASYEDALRASAELSIRYADMNSWIYTSRITMNHNIAHGFGSMEKALSRIKADVLLIANQQDLLEDWHLSAEMVDCLVAQGKNASLLLIDSDFGHMAGILQTELFEHRLKLFLAEEERGRLECLSQNMSFGLAK